MEKRRFLVVRYPDPGPPALVGAPNDFKDEEAALARLRDITKRHRKVHHTSLDVISYVGSKQDFLEEKGIMQ